MDASPCFAFEALVLTTGRNPYVEIPAELTQAFLPWTKAGRVAVEVATSIPGERAIRASLVPIKGGRQRLYLNRGMRAALGADLGETVTLRLRALPREEVRTPADLAEELEGLALLTLFESLSPSHRREYLRWIDEARTDESRRRRIVRTAEELASRSRPTPALVASPEPPATRPLWVCPKCGQSFVNRNQYHSCARHDLEEPFRGKPTAIRELFEDLRRMIEGLGPVTLVPYRDRVGFMVRVRFAGAVPRQRWPEVNFWLPRRLESERFKRVETLLPGVHIHTLRLTSMEDLDGELAAWLAEAYAVGRQAGRV